MSDPLTDDELAEIERSFHDYEGADVPRLVAEIRRLRHDRAVERNALAQAHVELDRLGARRDELLATIVKLSQIVPFESEIAAAIEQRGALLAEIGTLRSAMRQIRLLLDPAGGGIGWDDAKLITKIQEERDENYERCLALRDIRSELAIGGGDDICAEIRRRHVELDRLRPLASAVERWANEDIVDESLTPADEYLLDAAIAAGIIAPPPALMERLPCGQTPDGRTVKTIGLARCRHCGARDCFRAYIEWEKRADIGLNRDLYPLVD